MEPLVVLYDGSCGLCHRGVQYAARLGKPGAYRFLPNDDPEAVELLRRHGLEDQVEDTMVILEGGKAYLRSSGAVRVALRFRWPHRWQAAVWLVPRPLRDAAYRFVAKRRRHVCKLP